MFVSADSSAPKQLLILARSNPHASILLQQIEPLPRETLCGMRELIDAGQLAVHLAWPDHPGRLDAAIKAAAYRLLRAPVSAAGMRQLVESNSKYDVILGNSKTWVFNLASARRLSLLQDVRTVAVCFGLAEFLAGLASWQRKLLVWVLQSLDAIVVYSEVEASDLRALGLENVAVVPFGVDDSFWSPTSGPPGNFIFSPGSDPRRDWETLIRACRHPLVLATQNSSISPDALPSHVTVCSGSLSDMRTLYDHCRCVAVTLPESRRIAGEYTVLQAMAMAKPVIVTRTNGSSAAILRDQENCFMVSPGDVEELRAVLDEVWAGGEHIKQVARRGRATVLEYYNSRRYAADLSAVLLGTVSAGAVDNLKPKVVSAS